MQIRSRCVLVLGLLVLVAAPVLAGVSSARGFCLGLTPVEGPGPQPVLAPSRNAFAPDHDPFRTSLRIESAGRWTCEFASGEPIALVVRITNSTNEMQQLDISPDSKTHDFYVLRPGTDEIVWRWSDNRIFDRSDEPLTFGPGETRTFRQLWDQVDSEGNPVGPGRYEIVGSIEGDTSPIGDFETVHPLKSARVGVWVRP